MSGDGIEETLQQHAAFVRGLARQLVADATTADDVAQQTWMAYLRRSPRAGSGIRGWLATVARRAASRMGREEARRAAREYRVARPESSPRPGDLMEREAAIRRVVDAVFTLPEPYRSAIVMRFYEGMEPRDIGSRLGIPAATVRTRIHRGLEQLRNTLDHGSGAGQWRLALLPVAFGFPTGLVVPASSALATGAALSGGAPLLGSLVMKKALLCLAVVMAATLTAVVWNPWSERDDSRPPSPPMGTHPIEESADAGTIESLPGHRPIVTTPYEETRREGDQTAASRDASPVVHYASIRGRVTDEAHRPVAGAKVTVTLAREETGAARGYSEDTLPELTTSTDGRFHADRIPVGVDARILARPETLCDALHIMDVEKAEAIDVGDLVARVGGSVAGHVTLPPDVDPGLVHVLAWPAPQKQLGLGAFILHGGQRRSGRRGSLDEDHRYRVDGLDAGSWQIAVHSPGFASETTRTALVRVRETVWDVDLVVSSGLEIAGRIEDGSGAPLSGARVSLRTPSDSPVVGFAGAVETSVTTGPDGRFRFRGLDERPRAVTASCAGHVGADAPPAQPGGPPVVLRMPRTGRLIGRLAFAQADRALPASFEVHPSADGRPSMHLHMGGMRVLYGEEAAAAAGVAADPGLFLVEDVPAHPIRLLVRAPRCAEQLFRGITVAPEETRELTVLISPEVTIRGTVLDHAGTPVAGARVSTRLPDDTPKGPGLAVRREVRIGGPAGGPAMPAAVGSVSTMTGADGTFVLRGLDRNAVLVIAEHDDHASSKEEPVDLTLGDGVAGLTLHLQEAGRVVGVARAAGGSPLQSERLVIRGRPQPTNTRTIPITRRTVTDDRGRFELLGLSPGAYEATFEDTDAVTLGASLVLMTEEPLPGVTRFEITPGGTTRVELVQPVRVDVTGVVREAGLPAPGIPVSLQARDDDFGIAGGGIPTDGNGAFLLRNVVPGAYRIRVDPPGSVLPVTHFVDVRESGPNHAVIDLPTGSVSGQVLDKTTGAPVAGLIVGIVRAKAGAQGAKPDRRQVIMVAVTADSEGPAVTRVGLDGTAPVRTDADGRFLVRYLAADTYNVSVSGGDYTPATQRDVVVKEALETKRVDLQVDRGSTLLVTAEGSSNPRVFLARLFRDGEESSLQVEVSSDGRPIRFQGLSPGRYRVEVTVPMEEGVKGQQEVDVPGGGLEIPLTVKLRAT